MSEITIYHNPRCSKSRETLKLLTDSGVEPVVVHYLETPPDLATLSRIVEMLGCDPIDIVRTGEPMFRELGFHEKRPANEDLLAAMVAHPVLIERPIVVKDGKAVVGRPPRNVMTLLE